MNIFTGGGNGREVQWSNELARVLALPRRRWSDEDLKALVAAFDAQYRRPGAKMSFFPLQAQALFELSLPGAWGVVAALDVGEGKTLVGFLAPLLAKKYRPIFLIPAGLREKTENDLQKYSEHFPIPNYIRIEHYEKLSISPTLLDEYAPDIIIADEAHALGNRCAGCTGRVIDFMHKNLGTLFLPMTGTLTTRTIGPAAHLSQLALREGSPLPIDPRVTTEWALHLDERKGAQRSEPGMLLRLCNEEDIRQEEPARLGLQRRLRDTRGFVSSFGSGQRYGGSIRFDFERLELPKFVADAIAEMRKTWTTPNGTTFKEALALYRKVREMALGFYYHWDPPPPVEWKKRRKEWYATCRHILTYNRRGLRTPAEVTNAVLRGDYPNPIDDDSLPPLELYERWKEIKDTYAYRKVPAWLSSFLIDYLAGSLVKREPTLVWVYQEDAFAEALSRATGLPYYAAEGKDRLTGVSIEQDPGGRSAILSVDANCEGRNLQDRWYRNLFVNFPPNGKIVEQVIGRTHRYGQRHDDVLCTVVVTCPEHELAVAQALADARSIQQSFGKTQKILLADFASRFTLPSDLVLSS